MKLNDFFRSSFKIATAIFLAVVALTIVGVGVWKIQDLREKEEAQKYELVKSWRVDLSKNFQFDLTALTKVVDGRMLVRVTLDGNPPYLADYAMREKNYDRQFTLLFNDKDGFNLITKVVKIKDLTGILDDKGVRVGYRYEFDEFVRSSTYAKFSDLGIQWNLDTKMPVLPVAKDTPTDVGIQKLDHCAPNLSKAERLKRLSQYGTLRQISDGNYEVGLHSVYFSGGYLIDCK